MCSALYSDLITSRMGGVSCEDLLQHHHYIELVWVAESRVTFNNYYYDDLVKELRTYLHSRLLKTENECTISINLQNFNQCQIIFNIF